MTEQQIENCIALMRAGVRSAPEQQFDAALAVYFEICRALRLIAAQSDNVVPMHGEDKAG